MRYLPPWFYRNLIMEPEDVEGYDSFVYLITNKINGKRYIGKKTLVSRRTKVVNGKKKKTKTASDWWSYYGSNKALKDDVKLYGTHNFTREILHLCRNRGSANYLEAKEQFERGVLETDGWYNDWILVKVARSHVKLDTQPPPAL